MPPQNSRGLKDAKLSANVALPNAGNTVTTNSIDLGSAEPFPVTEKFSVELATTAGTGANSKNITVVLQHSDEASTNFTNVSELAPLVIAEADSAYPATTRTVQLPPGAKRYLRASATGEAAGGNAADGSVTVSLLF